MKTRTIALATTAAMALTPAAAMAHTGHSAHAAQHQGHRTHVLKRQLSKGLRHQIDRKLRHGHNGANGANGAAGVNGVNGVNGKDGVNGRDGKNGLNGVSGYEVKTWRYSKDDANSDMGPGYVGVGSGAIATVACSPGKVAIGGGYRFTSPQSVSDGSGVIALPSPAAWTGTPTPSSPTTTRAGSCRSTTRSTART